MNILIPDSWLRTFVKTKATPTQIKEYLSLCGPSVERIYEESGEPVYDVEITTNRPDAMSVFGIAREASVILPRFGIEATLIGNPYDAKMLKATGDKKLKITTNPILNPRWASVILSGVTVKDSPKWLTDWLTKTGIRPINTVVDVTNFLMRAYGQPAHAFDYDAIDKQTLKLRASKPGEILTTLDSKTHTLPGDDIVIVDGSGALIDLCGIMGGENSSIKPSTKQVILFIQTYDPIHIRKTSMKLAHRTEAASLFEKGVDSELVMPALIKGIELLQDIAGARIASPIQDIYPEPYKPYNVTVARTKIDNYTGTQLSHSVLMAILSPLGFRTTISKKNITVSVPSWRRDITIDVDIIEEIARIYGYHSIASYLPSGNLPMAHPDEALKWEEEIKIRMRDWGYTEIYTYSMISETQMDAFELDKKKAYAITNPLSEDWVYMRPSLLPSVLTVLKDNKQHNDAIRVFELSHVYKWNDNDLPTEQSELVVAGTGISFSHLKGIGETLLDLFGITAQITDYGNIQLHGESWILSLRVSELIRDANPIKVYVPVSKYPPVVEDLTFVVPEKFAIGPLLTALKTAHPVIVDVTLVVVYENTRTLHIVYQNAEKNLTSEEILPIRQALIQLAKDEFGAILKSA